VIWGIPSHSIHSCPPTAPHCHWVAPLPFTPRKHATQWGSLSLSILYLATCSLMAIFGMSPRIDDNGNDAIGCVVGDSPLMSQQKFQHESKAAIGKALFVPAFLYPPPSVFPLASYFRPICSFPLPHACNWLHGTRPIALDHTFEPREGGWAKWDGIAGSGSQSNYVVASHRPLAALTIG